MLEGQLRVGFLAAVDIPKGTRLVYKIPAKVCTISNLKFLQCTPYTYLQFQTGTPLGFFGHQQKPNPLEQIYPPWKKHLNPLSWNTIMKEFEVQDILVGVKILSWKKKRLCSFALILYTIWDFFSKSFPDILRGVLRHPQTTLNQFWLILFEIWELS